MSPRTKKQLAAHKKAKKEQIITGSLHLFADKGYFNTSVGDIAKKLNISKGLLYNYFDNKEQLLNEVLEFALKEASELNLKEEELKKLEPVEIFKEIIGGYFKVLEEKKELWRLIVSLAVHVSTIPSVHKTILMVYEELTKQFEELFILMGHEDYENEAIKLGALMDGVGIQYMIFGKSYPLDKIKESIIKAYSN